MPEDHSTVKGRNQGGTFCNSRLLITEWSWKDVDSVKSVKTPETKTALVLTHMNHFLVLYYTLHGVEQDSETAADSVRTLTVEVSLI